MPIQYRKHKNSYMIYVNPYVEREFESGGWVTKTEDIFHYTLVSNLRRAAINNGLYESKDEAVEMLNKVKKDEMIIFSKIVEFTHQEICDLTRGEEAVISYQVENKSVQDNRT
jgi:hypothetical protein